MKRLRRLPTADSTRSGLRVEAAATVLLVRCLAKISDMVLYDFGSPYSADSYMVRVLVLVLSPILRSFAFSLAHSLTRTFLRFSLQPL
jgi:hypothetical protein